MTFLFLTMIFSINYDLSEVYKSLIFHLSHGANHTILKKNISLNALL